MARGKAAGAGGAGVFGLELQSWLSTAGSVARGKAKAPAAAKGAVGRLIYCGVGKKVDAALEAHSVELLPWQKERAQKKRGEAVLVSNEGGPVWLLVPAAKTAASGGHGGLLELSPYAAARDLFGFAAGQVQDFGITELAVSFHEASAEEHLGALVGLELGAYRYRQVCQPKTLVNPRPRLMLPAEISQELIDEATALGVSTNLARHLVNTPAGRLHPESYAAAVTALFKGSATSTVDIWTGARLAKERMGLLEAVGQGASHGARLIHVRYRPKGKLRAQKPLAFIGKGITFDTGGLDLKDAGSMRLMKKDMGGSASVLGLAYWAELSGVDVPLDFYLAVAENSVDAAAFRPGDILTARNGQTVEIDNTDAEGRLVLADALDVALTTKGKDEPAALIDLATLTGAMRVGLGTRLAGLFANDDKLADAILRAGVERGDLCWRMPLFADYAPQLKSIVADVANSGPSRFGGAITAALFLGRFVGQARWVHIDMYGWTEGGHGALLEAGGNGQCVQGLARFLMSYRE